MPQELRRDIGVTAAALLMALFQSSPHYVTWLTKRHPHSKSTWEEAGLLGRSVGGGAGWHRAGVRSPAQAMGCTLSFPQPGAVCDTEPARAVSGAGRAVASGHCTI